MLIVFINARTVAGSNGFQLSGINIYCKRCITLLWRFVKTMLGRDRDTTGGRPTGHSADSFAAFFVRKVDDVRAGHSKTLEQPANLSSPA